MRLPARSFWDVALNVVGIWQLLMIVAAFVIAMVFMRFAVVGRLRRLTRPRSRSRSARPRELWAPRRSIPKSRNELDQLALATERLRVSINMAIQRLTKKGGG